MSCIYCGSPHLNRPDPGQLGPGIRAEPEEVRKINLKQWRHQKENKITAENNEG
jgi:hypothetical protein